MYDKITDGTLHFRHDFDVICSAAKLCSLVLLFLVLDQLVKSADHIIDATELPLSHG